MAYVFKMGFIYLNKLIATRGTVGRNEGIHDFNSDAQSHSGQGL